MLIPEFTQFSHVLSTTTFSANLTGGTLASAAIAILASANVHAGLLQFDATTKTYNQVAVVIPSGATQLSFPLPNIGSYVFVAFNISSPIPTFYGYARELTAGVVARVAYFYNQTQQFAINVTAQADADLTVNFSTSTSNPQPENYIQVGAYFDIETSSAASVVANLSYTFDQAAVEAKGIALDTLQFAYYTASGWKFDGNAQVSGNVVTQGTTHFSSWGVYGQSSDAVTLVASSLTFLALLLVAL